MPRPPLPPNQPNLPRPNPYGHLHRSRRRRNEAAHRRKTKPALRCGNPCRLEDRRPNKTTRRRTVGLARHRQNRHAPQHRARPHPRTLSRSSPQPPTANAVPGRTRRPRKRSACGNVGRRLPRNLAHCRILPPMDATSRRQQSPRLDSPTPRPFSTVAGAGTMDAPTTPTLRSRQPRPMASLAFGSLIPMERRLPARLEKRRRILSEPAIMHRRAGNLALRPRPARRPKRLRCLFPRHRRRRSSLAPRPKNPRPQTTQRIFPRRALL